MARFRATIQGSRGLASRLGTTKSGIRAHIDGWDIGVQVIAMLDADGNDVIHVYKTGGSNKPYQYKQIAVVKEDKNG